MNPNKLKEIQSRYHGFLETPFLWHGRGVFDLIHFSNEKSKTGVFTLTIDKNPRLGKLVERFVSFELGQCPHIDILAENIQIQQEKITLGELDCILLQKNIPIHLEVVYKFYLFVPTTESDSPLHNWIGPNKKDSLIQKLTKLKEKQFPLLYQKETLKYLKKLPIDITSIKQQVYFKAQLFIPLKQRKQHAAITPLNQNCIVGFYCKKEELSMFKSDKFFIPKKHDWLVIPHQHVTWTNFKIFESTLQTFLNEQNSPLCWVKKSNGEIIKLFVVWW